MRWDVINALIEKYKLSSYLEIGYQYGENFQKIKCDRKIAVDPMYHPGVDFKGTSDQYFAQVDKSVIHDLVFIDGLHHADQVERDIVNAINVVKARIVVIHDCNPTSEMVQRVPRETRIWYGNVWRAFVGFRLKYPSWETYCIDQDCGIGVIAVSDSVEPGFVTDLSWEEFQESKEIYLGI